MLTNQNSPNSAARQTAPGPARAPARRPLPWSRRRQMQTHRRAPIKPPLVFSYPAFGATDSLLSRRIPWFLCVWCCWCEVEGREKGGGEDEADWEERKGEDVLDVVERCSGRCEDYEYVGRCRGRAVGSQAGPGCRVSSRRARQSPPVRVWYLRFAPARCCCCHYRRGEADLLLTETRDSCSKQSQSDTKDDQRARRSDGAQVKSIQSQFIDLASSPPCHPVPFSHTLHPRIASSASFVIAAGLRARPPAPGRVRRCKTLHSGRAGDAREIAALNRNCVAWYLGMCVWWCGG
jgi:hypothetical protein